ncbi:MAG: hypothetical protein M1326_10320 [Cyanobacteria bacterium]|nr:hypothetical protein [Cyanobacteriota bacterium]
MIRYISKNRKIISLILIGVVFRLLFSLFFTHIFDFRNILALVKSVADTGGITAGFFVLKKSGFEIQLYGKIYYQIAALWLFILDKLKLIDIRYLFDIGAYKNFSSYMVGLYQWDPPLYQFVSIKLIQFFYDFVFLYFFYKLALEIKIKNTSLVLLLWAINPFLVFAPYAMFQSDLAMLAFLTGGIYFAVKSLNNIQNKTKYILLSLFCLAIGAVIKQVPILFLPVVLIIFSETIISFILYLLFFLFAYVIISQPWSSDASFIKQFFLQSKESLALFNFQLNGVSIFLLSYCILIFFILINKNKIRLNSYFLVHISILIIGLILITENSDFLFPQFNIWIIPFLILIALLDHKYSIFIAAPIIGFLKRSMIDNDFLSGALSTSFGKQLSHLPRSELILLQLFNPTLINIFLNTLIIATYLLLFVLIIGTFLKSSKLNAFLAKYEIYFQKYYKSILILFFLSYFVFLFPQYSVKSKYVILNTGSYEDINTPIYLKNQKISLVISNPNLLTINGLKIQAVLKNGNNYDSLIFQFINKDDNK